MIEGRVKVMGADSPDGEVLFECPVEEEERAYAFAREMEALGVEVRVFVPGISETLASSLGVSEGEWREYRESMEREIGEHGNDCQASSCGAD